MKKSVCKSSRGFTLTELIAAVSIISLMLVVAVPIYLNVTNNNKENEYNSKKLYLESLAARYAEEHNINDTYKISVSRLIASGYIGAEKYIDVDGQEIPFISNPKSDDDNLACHIIEFSINNYEYSATMGDVSDCSFAVSDVLDSKMGIKAYRIKDNKIGDSIFINNEANLDWVNDDVLIVVNPQYSNYTALSIGVAGNTKIVDTTKMLTNEGLTRYKNNKTEINLNNYSNVELIMASVITKQSVSVAVEADSTIKTSTVNVRIDKEAPTIDSKKFSGWTSEEKGALVFLSDGAGSGSKGVYISKTQNFEDRDKNIKNVETDSNGYSEETVAISRVNGEALKNQRYYLWAEDKAGNISPVASYIDVSNVDKDKPHTTGIKVESTKPGYNTANVKITVSADDGTGSGVTHLCIKLTEGSSDCTWQSFGVINDYKLPTTEGSGAAYRLFAYTKDAVGNISEEKVYADYTVYKKCSQTKTTTTSNPTVYNATYNAAYTTGLDTCVSTMNSTGLTKVSERKADSDSYTIPKTECEGTPIKKNTCWKEYGGQCCSWIWDGACNATGGVCAPEQVCNGQHNCPIEEKCGEHYECKSGYTPKSNNTKCCKEVTKCKSGYTKSSNGKKCVGYSCNPGEVLEGKKCVTYTASCPSGYVWNGSQCVSQYNCCKGDKVNKGTYCEAYYYTCPQGGTLYSKYCIKGQDACDSTCTVSTSVPLFEECKNIIRHAESANCYAKKELSEHNNSNNMPYNHNNEIRCDSYEFDFSSHSACSQALRNGGRIVTSEVVIPLQTTSGISCVYKDSIASNSNNNYNSSQTTCSEYDRMRGRCRNDSNPGSTSYSTPSPKVADNFIYNAATHQCEVSLCAEPRKVLSDDNNPTYTDLYSLRCASASCVNQVDKYLQ